MKKIFNRQHEIENAQVGAFRKTPVSNSAMPFTASKRNVKHRDGSVPPLKRLPAAGGCRERCPPEAGGVGKKNYT